MIHLGRRSSSSWVEAKKGQTAPCCATLTEARVFDGLGNRVGRRRVCTMTCGLLTLFVHAVGTTGAHRRERRRHRYAAHCAQCGVAVDRASHVAAHVVRYDAPCCLPRAGVLTLVTTCRTCNGRQQAGEDGVERCCAPRARFWRCRSPGSVVLGAVRRLWCWRYVLADPGQQATFPAAAAGGGPAAIDA